MITEQTALIVTPIGQDPILEKLEDFYNIDANDDRLLLKNYIKQIKELASAKPATSLQKKFFDIGRDTIHKIFKIDSSNKPVTSLEKKFFDIGLDTIHKIFRIDSDLFWIVTKAELGLSNTNKAVKVRLGKKAQYAKAYAEVATAIIKVIAFLGFVCGVYGGTVGAAKNLAGPDGKNDEKNTAAMILYPAYFSFLFFTGLFVAPSFNIQGFFRMKDQTAYQVFKRKELFRIQFGQDAGYRSLIIKGDETPSLQEKFYIRWLKELQDIVHGWNASVQMELTNIQTALKDRDYNLDDVITSMNAIQDTILRGVKVSTIAYQMLGGLGGARELCGTVHRDEHFQERNKYKEYYTEFTQTLPVQFEKTVAKLKEVAYADSISAPETLTEIKSKVNRHVRQLSDTSRLREQFSANVTGMAM